jgi:hypothetical protein
MSRQSSASLVGLQGVPRLSMIDENEALATRIAPLFEASMRIVVLDGYTLGADGNSWNALRALDEVEVHARSSADEVAARARGASVLITNKASIPALRQRPEECRRGGPERRIRAEPCRMNSSLSRQPEISNLDTGKAIYV